MTATNHALTGAVIALIAKQPALAIPLAFLSHFVLDLIPHYNPTGITNKSFVNHAESWRKKMRVRSFRLIFATDMVLAFILLLSIPFIAVSDVTIGTIFFSMVAAAAPDFLGGLDYLYFLATGKKTASNWFDKFHVRLQWMERPWGIYVEIFWAVAMFYLILALSK